MVLISFIAENCYIMIKLNLTVYSANITYKPSPTKNIAADGVVKIN